MTERAALVHPLEHSSNNTSNGEEDSTGVAGQIGSVVGVVGAGGGLGGGSRLLRGVGTGGSCIGGTGALGLGGGRLGGLGSGAVEGGLLAVDLDLALGAGGSGVIGAVVEAASKHHVSLFGDVKYRVRGSSYVAMAS